MADQINGPKSPSGHQNFAIISEQRRWRFFVFFILYVAQGVPFGLILMALPAYLAAQNVDPVVIAGFLSAALLPHAIKIINAPIMDRWTFWPMGRRRPWVLIAQLFLLMSFLALAFIPNPVENIALLTAGCFAVNFCGAFQDVATDGMAVDLLPEEDQPKASGIMFGGVVLSGAGFAAATGWTLSEFGLFETALACAACVVILSLVPLFSLERPGERFLPWTDGRASRDREPPPGNFREIAGNVRKYFFLRASLLLAAAIALYGISRGIHLTLAPAYFVQELGWTDTAFSAVSGVALLVGGGFAMLFGGAIMEKLGRRHTFMMACGLMAIFAVVIVAYPAVRDSDVALQAYRIAYNTLDTLTVVASIALGMAISARVISATQFALFMGLSNVGYSVGSAIFGKLHTVLTYPQIFVAFAMVATGSAAVIYFVGVEKHRQHVHALETKPAAV